MYGMEMIDMHAVNKPSMTKKVSKSIAPKQTKPSLCNHRFAHLETKKTDDIVADEHSNCYIHFKRIDIFYCEKCLEYKIKVLEDVAKEQPDWF
jgi:hypothetical protein